jgi:three-Cys-motif partner protein
MAGPQETYWDLDAHSAGKHAILRHYLEAWFPIMASSHRRMILVDAFAGPGRYQKNESGSPLVMLDVWMRHPARSRYNSDVACLFIEERIDRAAALEAELGALQLPRGVTYTVVTGRYEDTFEPELHRLQGSEGSDTPTFVFLDPFGYSDAPLDLTGTFMQFSRTEALIYLPLYFVHRFLARDAQERPLDSLFGTDRWRAGLKLKGKLRRQFLHDLFIAQLKTHGSKYVAPFEIQSDESHGYELYFATNSLLGLEKMKDAIWKVDPVMGTTYNPAWSADLLPLKSPPQTQSLMPKLREHFGRQPFTIEEAQEFTLAETVFRAAHLRQAGLVPLEKAGLLRVHPQSSRRRGTFPQGTVMEILEDAPTTQLALPIY